MSNTMTRDFSAKTRRALANKGIAIVSVTSIPSDGDMPWANSTRGYVVNDNDTQRICTHSQVLAMATERCDMERAIQAAFDARTLNC